MTAFFDSASGIALVVAVVVAVFTSVTAPLMMSRRIDERHREDRDADWARQDIVAAKAEAAAALLADNQNEAARLLKLNNAQTQAIAADTQAQLREIHVAVNSTLTARMAETLEALRAQLALMRRLLDDPSPDETKTMRSLEAAIADLQVMVADRHTQQDPKGDL